MRIIHRALFRLSNKLFNAEAFLRRALYLARGLSIGKTRLPRITMTWPHKVRIGDGCFLEPDIIMQCNGPGEPGVTLRIGDRTFIGNHCEFNIAGSIVIGSDRMIASGCKFIDHYHGNVDMTKLMG